MPDWILLLIVAIFDFLLGLFIKNYLPSYMDEKGKNLATKEDVQEITKLTEEVQQNFRKELESFNSELHFKYDFYYKQYELFYSYLYAVIVQSEYVRQYLKKLNGQEVSFEEEPFLTISPTHRQTQKLELKQGKPMKITGHTEEIETPVSKFNFDELVNYIVKNSALADQDLMKYAVSYRFAHHVSNGQGAEAENEETRLQVLIIETIIKTYNRLRRDLRMRYSETELRTGSFQSV